MVGRARAYRIGEQHDEVVASRRDRCEASGRTTEDLDRGRVVVLRELGEERPRASYLYGARAFSAQMKDDLAVAIGSVASRGAALEDASTESVWQVGHLERDVALAGGLGQKMDPGYPT